MNNEYELINHATIKYLNLFLVKLKYRTPHYHNEMELGLILRGSLNITRGGNLYLLQENDIFLLNPGESHELFSDGEDVLILSVQISSKFFCNHFAPMKKLHFLTFSLSRVIDEDIYSELLHSMHSLADTYLRHQDLFEFKCIIIMNQIMYELLQHVPYKILTSEEQATLSSRIGRLNRVINYVDENYNRKLLLQEIADSEQLSLTYLSHFIKEQLGMPFQSYLNHVRLEHAVSLLETTDLSLIDICLESGFSDTRYLNKLFYMRYGCTPKLYRNNSQKKQADKNHFVSSLQRILSPEESLEVL